MQPPVTNLELPAEVMQAMGEACVRAVVQHIAALPGSPRANLAHAVEIARSLREAPPETGTAFDELLTFLMEKVIPISINAAHPAYLAYIPGGGLFPSALADLLSAATNRYVGAWFAAPAAARLETNVLEWFAQWMGYPAGARGILTSGGSLAGFSAIVTARQHLLGEEIGRGVVYASTQTHHSLLKGARLAGLRERNLRLLEVDHRFRAVPELFEAAIQADLAAGLQPFLLIGNAGTTNTGAIDPLEELAALSRKYSLWYHIDGAYGGFFNLCEEGRRKLAGIEQSDSLVLDPHKGLFVPYGCGSLLVKEGELLRRAHLLTADYMQDQFTPPGEVNFTDYSPELSRSFRGLKVWLPLKLFGVQAFRENLAEKLRLARWLYQRLLETPGFECLVEPELSVVAFRYRPRRGGINEFNRRLLAHINGSGRLFLSSTLLRGEFVLRACVLSFRTHQAEVEEALEVIATAAKELENAPAR
ncbi:MAG: aminotransferase class V-fold PLP-dependent enzyme [candidate division KSB1 bacterium]|nr:aminotransferase class V-fold PLP-dependent enzyme [candidate division KSB1 bacterium]MDZ7273702.1 aminotransferase class V-fold PLP-dependent enzyme [candidate division KSB1 bacterium]MDZ7285858.1 aminotransferase class V-fold PLP-dependent enzyme [candidate division KSB1 bacterium]MDZ7298890.1 aminotransferase class V-fold PLP-dependent enzyme [candidate division KSB1 bacterium]MDZ7309079.1 aminotransferase class V-fold PLP-dependent enzyme [candidate division KSB1 bacterium]